MEPICQWIKFLQRQSISFTDAEGKGSELTFKILQSGDGMRTINSSLLDVILTFMLGNILTYCFKQLVATVAKRIAKSQDSFSILRIHTVHEAKDKLIKAFTRGVRSSIYSNTQATRQDLGIVYQKRSLLTRQTDFKRSPCCCENRR